MARWVNCLMAMAAAFTAVAVGAETLPVEGVYPAGIDDAAALQVIAVEPFGGVDGQQLGIAIADRLRAAAVHGAPYFRIVPGGLASEAEAVLQGTATAEITRREAGTREEETCTERDEDRKCVKKVKEKVPCWNIVARLNPAIRLIGLDGDLLYAVDQAEEQSQRYCRGEERPSGERLVDQIVARVAGRVRGDLAPVQRLEQFRVLESRRGLAGDDSRAFREAVRLTKTDQAGACDAWRALEPSNPDHISVVFNLGLCAESRDELDQAEEYYRRTLSAEGDSSYAQQGLQRIDERRRAERQLAAHRAS